MAFLAGLLLLLSMAAAFPQNTAPFVPPPLPVIPNQTFYVTNYGAVGDGLTNNTLWLSNAISAASLAGGGTVEITAAAGAYLSGPLALKSSINLQIDAGAVLRMLPYDTYPGGIINPPDFITGSNLRNVEISGSGAIDGQGSPWWPGYKTNNRPVMVNFSACSTGLIQNVTFSNSPAQHIVVKGKAGFFTIQGITVTAPSSSAPTNPSHNTDAIDLAETNCLIQNCHLSVGDDNVAVGSSASISRNILITNCTFGIGHGVSIGSYTSSGVSNMTVVNCTFNGTDNGIRMKSDNDRGGIVQNLSYLNLGMTNVIFPIVIYSYYNAVGTPNNITPATAAGEPVAAVTGTTPIWRNFLISNVTATVSSSGIAGIIWGRTELPAANITMTKVNIAAPKTFDIYNARGIQFADAQVTLPGSAKTFTLFNAGLTVTNSAPGAGLVTLDGLASSNSLAFYNSLAGLSDPTALGANPVSLNASTLTVSNDLNLDPSDLLNFALGTNTTKLSVTGNLALNGTLNVSAGPGFTNATYTLCTYGAGLTWGPLTLGATPAGYTYAFDTNTAGQVKLAVLPTPPAAPTNLVAAPTNSLVQLNWSPVATATSYNVKRSTVSHGSYAVIAPGLTSTNYADASVTNAVTYFYVASAINAGGESTNSIEVAATPAPSLTPVTLTLQPGSNPLRLSWPADHTGWRLQIQTNDLAAGLGTNWLAIPDSQQTNQAYLPIDPANGGVFLRLVYP